ncbi:flavodoxin [Microbacterium sp. 2FI]|uniref:flavodoxin n=1 Tax=Microbacterium sp. 2FI TaxID=2502193 RepID=UPI0010F8BA65|nr:flavodoxin [Microbacterium sp. 2FI]
MDRRDFLITTGLLGAGLLASTLAACTPSPEAAMPTESPPTPATVPTPAAAPTSTNRVLLAYFSRPGENYYYGDRIALETGNTQVVAEMIAATASVDIYRIEAADPYPEDYEATVARNVQEENVDARPAIANPLPDLTPYDTVLLGSPVWNVQTPMIMRTFVESTDLAGKTIHPFVTYAVSGIGRVENDYAELCPDSTLGESLAVQGEQATEAGADVAAWIRRIGL